MNGTVAGEFGRARYWFIQSRHGPAYRVKIPEKLRFRGPRKNNRLSIGLIEIMALILDGRCNQKARE